MASSPSGRTPDSPDDTDGGRPHVLVLGGGFGGVGAARKLKDAEVDVTLVDQHDYHTFQPLLYQVATDLLETVRVRPSAARPVPRAAERHRPRGHGDRHRPRPPRGAVRGDGAAHLRLPRRWRSAPGSTSSGSRAQTSTRFPMYTLADAVRLKDHVLRRWEAADRDPALVEDGALNVVVVGGGPTGIESAGALAELYRSNFAEDYPGIPQDQARIVLVEAGPALMSMFKLRHPLLHEEGAGEARRRGAAGRGGRLDRADPRHARSRGR